MLYTYVFTLVDLFNVICFGEDIFKLEYLNKICLNKKNITDVCILYGGVDPQIFIVIF